MIFGRGSSGDPMGIRWGSKGDPCNKLGDPHFLPCAGLGFWEGSGRTTERFYNIRKENQGSSVLGSGNVEIDREKPDSRILQT